MRYVTDVRFDDLKPNDRVAGLNGSFGTIVTAKNPGLIYSKEVEIKFEDVEDIVVCAYSTLNRVEYIGVVN